MPGTRTWMVMEVYAQPRASERRWRRPVAWRPKNSAVLSAAANTLRCPYPKRWSLAGVRVTVASMRSKRDWRFRTRAW